MVAFFMILAVIGAIFTVMAAVADEIERRERKRERDMHRRRGTGPYATAPYVRRVQVENIRRFAERPRPVLNPRRPW